MTEAHLCDSVCTPIGRYAGVGQGIALIIERA